MGELVAFADRLERVLDAPAQGRILHAMGGAGKKVALDRAERDLGIDRTFSGMRRKVKLGAGYDLDAPAVVIKLRPAGLWKLADGGRYRSGRIDPRGRRTRSRRRAVRTPRGMRHHSSYGRSRGLRTVEEAIRSMETECPKAAALALDRSIEAI